MFLHSRIGRGQLGRDRSGLPIAPKAAALTSGNTKREKNQFMSMVKGEVHNVKHERASWPLYIGF